MQPLHTENRFILNHDGTCFFYLADTAWELVHKLTREEIDLYCSERQGQGFTAFQTVALAELDGLYTPNAYGRLPLKMTDSVPDPTRPDTDGEYSYWDHLDYTVRTAMAHELYVVLLPTWGDKFNLKWGKGPEIFTPQNARIYGRFVGSRYGGYTNIIWMLGGDRILEDDDRAIIDAMAEGIREADKEHLITFHPAGSSESSMWVNDADYIDFHTSQTGHATNKSYISYRVIEKMRAATDKPVLDSESRYEDHPACFSTASGYYWNADDVRQNIYWNLFSGACGFTYGNHAVWSMNTAVTDYTPLTWRDAIHRPGAQQVRYAKELFLSKKPLSIHPCQKLLTENLSGMGYMSAALGDGFAYIYSPLGIPFSLNAAPIGAAKGVRASWFDPRTGKREVFAVLPTNHDTAVAPPTQGKGCDWVLVLEDIG